MTSNTMAAVRSVAGARERLELRRRCRGNTLGGMNGKTVTREELYAAVWKSPLNKLAAKWSVAIASIVRASKAMDVPRSGAGHWQAVAKGWVMEATPLSAATKRMSTPVTLKPAGNGCRWKPTSKCRRTCGSCIR